MDSNLQQDVEFGGLLHNVKNMQGALFKENKLNPHMK